MSRINPMTADKAQNELKQIYQDLEKKIGRVPNIFQNLGNSPVVLKGFLTINELANQTGLNPKLREQIALTVAQTNKCQYCLSAHTTIGKGLGLQDQDLMKARHAQSGDAKTQAILKFAKTVVENRGNISNQDITTLKAAGVNDKELVEIFFVIMINMFTNYFNHITDPKIDFPAAPNLS